MFEEEIRAKKVYVTTGTSIMKDKDYFPQVTALIDNYRDKGEYSVFKDEYHTMIKNILKWSDDKIKRVTDSMLKSGVLCDTDTIEENNPIFPLIGDDDTYPIKRNSYILGVALNNLIRKEDKDYPLLTYKDAQIKYTTISGDTMFALLEKRNDLLFKLYIYLKMNYEYWTIYKQTPYNFYIKGRGGAVEYLGFSLKSGSAADRIRECVSILENEGYIVLGNQQSRGKKYGKFLGYYRPLYEVREIDNVDDYSDYSLLRVPDMCYDEVVDIIYKRMTEAGYPDIVPEKLIFSNL